MFPTGSFNGLPIFIFLMAAARSHAAFQYVHHNQQIRKSLYPSSSLHQHQPDDNDLDDVTPPILIFRKESILFGSNPETKRKNAILDAWKYCTTVLPPLVTGDGSSPADRIVDNDPMALFYNMIFVRIPTIVVGVLYFKNLATGHALIVDLGNGPLEVSSPIVVLVLYVILRLP